MRSVAAAPIAAVATVIAPGRIAGAIRLTDDRAGAGIAIPAPPRCLAIRGLSWRRDMDENRDPEEKREENQSVHSTPDR
ncbi:MAG: hypothetical protein ACK4OP_00890 [Gemmobacter sp.]